MIILQFFGIIILFIVVFFLVTLVSVVFRFWGLIRQFLGIKGGNSAYGSRSSAQQTNSYSDTSNKTTTHATSDTPQRKKIIPKDEGEYVDFEEV